MIIFPFRRCADASRLSSIVAKPRRFGKAARGRPRCRGEEEDVACGGIGLDHAVLRLQGLGPRHDLSQDAGEELAGEGLAVLLAVLVGLVDASPAGGALQGGGHEGVAVGVAFGLEGAVADPRGQVTGGRRRGKTA